MYIYGLHVCRFRGLKDLWFFPNPDLNVLIGPNNSGKTSLLNAMKLILDPSVNLRREDMISRFDFHEGIISDSISIRLWLKFDENESDDIRLQFGAKCSSWKKTDDNTLEPLLPDEPIAVPATDHLELLALELKIAWDDGENTAKPEMSIIDETDTHSDTFSLKDREKIGFKCFPAKRDPLYQFSMARYSLLSHALSDKTITTELRKIQKTLEELKLDLIKGTGLNDLFQSLNMLTAPEIMGGFDNFTLTFLDANLGKLRSATSLALEKCKVSEDSEGEVTDSGSGEDISLLPLSYLGDGMQNLLLLMQISKSTGAEEKGQHIIAIEEPEQNLEPSLAKWAFSEICKNYNKSKHKDGKGQVFVTTHSPSLIGEFKGAKSLCRIWRRDKKQLATNTCHVLKGIELSAAARKSLEQHRDRYSSALLAQHALIVEGASEEGLLPVIFSALANKPCENPFHLGLAIVNGENNSIAWKHSRNLKAFGLTTHLLMDYDIPPKKQDGQEISTLALHNSDFVSSWPNEPLLRFADGYDIEIMLVANLKPQILFEALKRCYEDPGHDLSKTDWSAAKRIIKDADIANALPQEFPEALDRWDLTSFNDELLQQAFLLAALHGPHNCKNAKDMRIIAEYVTENNSIPPILDSLRRRTVDCMVNAQAPKGVFFIK